LNESTRAVDRALNILLCFSVQTPELSMTQIAEQVGLNKSTVHRLLATLERKRFVERDPVTSRYRPGIRLLQMAYLTQQNNDLPRIALPFMRELGETHRETVDLSILDDTDVLYTEVVESPQRVRLAASKGQRLPAFCTASGKAILAFMPTEKVKSILERGMLAYTQYTCSNPEDLLKDLAMAKRDGFSISIQEYEEGINAVAAPIFDAGGHPIASIAIAGPAYRLDQEKLEAIGRDVVSTCEKINKELQIAFAPQPPDDPGLEDEEEE
jgi:IclR family transcriptional regulator, KDG regulon repressor